MTSHYHPCDEPRCAPWGTSVAIPIAPVHDADGRRVYITRNGVFVISEHGQWLPGAYADLPTALAAFDLDDEVLVELRDATDGPVTFAQVRAKTTTTGGSDG